MDYNQQLLEATRNGDIAKIKMAIEHGADMKAIDKHGNTAAMIATGLNRHTECLALLIEAGADLEAKNNEGWTVTIWAAWDGQTECLALLIKAGTNLEAEDEYGRTAATWAAGYENTECLALLIQAGINPTKETLNNKTVLEIAQDAGWENVISAWEDQIMQKKVGQKTSREEGDGFGL